jgi:hypothetical protein
MRLLYDGVTTPFAQRSRWFTMPWNGWNETDLELTRALGGFVWNDIDQDGLRDPGEPPITGSLVRLDTAGGLGLMAATPMNDGSYRLEVRFPGAHRLEFQPLCYGLTVQDQGADDLLDSDPNPATRLTTFIGPTLTDADETRWSAGIVAGNGHTPPTQAVVITGARLVNLQLARITLDVQDPNPPGSVSGYNVYRSSSAALPAAQWDLISIEVPDEDPTTPDIQLSHTSAPPVGGCSFYQVTAAAGSCGAEGPR